MPIATHPSPPTAGTVAACAVILYAVPGLAGQPGLVAWECRLRTPDGTRWRNAICLPEDEPAPDVRELAAGFAKYPQDWSRLA